MSGILGIWNLDGRPVADGLLSQMSATLAHRGHDGEGHWLDGPVGLACQLNRVTPESAAETQPLSHPAGAVAVFDGRLDNREELLSRLTPAPGVDKDAPDPALVLAAYGAWGQRFPEYLNGDFALAVFDPRRQQLLLARDAIGVRPLYYCQMGDIFLFASEIKALLAHPQVCAAPDEVSLANYLIRGSIQDSGATFFQGISNVPPGCRAILNHQNFLISRYWDFDPGKRIRFSSFQEYVQCFKQMFQKAITRRLRSTYPVAVPVSGGVDSSSIFCQAETLRRCSPDSYPPLVGISHVFRDGSPADEEIYLREIEKDYHLSIDRITGCTPGYYHGSKELVWNVETPRLDDLGSCTHALEAGAQAAGARVLLWGTWADQFLFDQAYLIDFFRHLSWGQIRHHLKEFEAWNPDVEPQAFIKAFLVDLARYYLPEGMLRWLRQVKSMVGQNNPSRQFYTERLRQHARYDIRNGGPARQEFASAHAWSLYSISRSTMNLSRLEWHNKVGCMHGLEVAYPYLDRDLLVYLMGIPGEMVVRQGVSKAILREAMRGVLPEAITGRRWKADFTHICGAGMSQDFDILHGFLKKGELAVNRGYVNREMLLDGIKGWQKRVRVDDGRVTWGLRDLFGLETWLGVFSGNLTHSID
jgi:asparagine synthase (glutamine-hydrolysing)